MPAKLYLCGMSLDKNPTVTDALDAIKALREELVSVKDELGGNSKKTSYGPKLQALVIYLSVVQSVTFDRIDESLRDVFCVKSFSEGTV